MDTNASTSLFIISIDIEDNVQDDHISDPTEIKIVNQYLNPNAEIQETSCA